ncbi:MAG: triose-phosphate isomerase [Rhodocyclaceae bacterium]|nr:MAG: triose-phosphate isomerase [Rhodocyclaceae bacterium]
MRTKLVAGNWKMHGTLATNLALLTRVRDAAAGMSSESAVCVPFPYLAQAQALLAGSRVAWGGQNVSEHAQGAYTGEVSATMLTEFGCRYVLVGHSERRAIYAESDATVAAKFAAALGAGLTPILCVGETLAEREAGTTGDVVTRQLDAVIGASGISALSRAVLAYEPVWAIGTGKTATPQQAQDVHALIRNRVAGGDPTVARELKILYGGSVKSGNAKELFAMPDIDGGLIGGASLVADDFLAICGAA